MFCLKIDAAKLYSSYLRTADALSAVIRAPACAGVNAVRDCVMRRWYKGEWASATVRDQVETTVVIWVSDALQFPTA